MVNRKQKVTSFRFKPKIIDALRAHGERSGQGRRAVIELVLADFFYKELEQVMDKQELENRTYNGRNQSRIFDLYIEKFKGETK